MAERSTAFGFWEPARYQAGPRGGMILSDLGAEVIKLENLGGEETGRWEPLVLGGPGSPATCPAFSSKLDQSPPARPRIWCPSGSLESPAGARRNETHLVSG